MQEKALLYQIRERTVYRSTQAEGIREWVHPLAPRQIRGQVSLA